MSNRFTLRGMLVATLALVVFAAGCQSQAERDAAGRWTKVRDSYVAQNVDPAARDTAAEAPSRAAGDDLSPSATLDDLLTYAALRNPGLEAAFNRWKAALERVPQVRSLPDPRFTYRHYIRSVETRVGPQENAFELAQMIPWPGKLDRMAAMAVEAAEAERQRFEAARLALEARVRDAWYEYAWWTWAVSIARDNRDLLQYFEEVARTRYKTATGSHPAVIRAQVELGRLEDRLNSLTDLESTLVARLNAALGRPAEAPVPKPGSDAFPRLRLTSGDAQVLAWLQEQSPALQALDHETARQQRAIELAEQQYFPDVTVGASVIDTDEALMPTPDSGKDPVIAMVSVNVPIWFDRLSAGVREAKARRRAALDHRADQGNQLEARAKMLLYQLRDAERKIDLYGNALIPKAEESVQTNEQAFRAGESSFLDLLDAERVMLDFQLAHARALADHAQRLADLEALVGRTLPTEPVTARPETGQPTKALQPPEAAPPAEGSAPAQGEGRP